MENVLSLLIPFIVLVLFSILVDRLVLVLQEIIKRVPYLPDEIENYITYGLVFIIAFIVCMKGNWSLFNYLDVQFDAQWQSYLISALLLSGGSTLVRSGFDMINLIPTPINNTMTSAKNIIASKVTNTINPNNATETIEEQSDSGSNTYDSYPI